MGRQGIDMDTLAMIGTCMSEYSKLGYHFPQLDPRQEETLSELKQKVLSIHDTQHFNEATMRQWNEVSMILTPQTWGSTAGGWGGVGGAAISTYYTVVFENRWYGFIAVYWSGKLAYIVKTDEKAAEYRKEMYRTLPGLNHVSEKLSVIYKHQR